MYSMTKHTENEKKFRFLRTDYYCASLTEAGARMDIYISINRGVWACCISVGFHSRITHKGIQDRRVAVRKCVSTEPKASHLMSEHVKCQAIDSFAAENAYMKRGYIGRSRAR